MSFFAVVDRVRLRRKRRDVDEVLALLWRAKAHAEIFQEFLEDPTDQPPSLDPLIASIPQTIRSWHEATRNLMRWAGRPWEAQPQQRPAGQHSRNPVPSEAY